MERRIADQYKVATAKAFGINPRRIDSSLNGRLHLDFIFDAAEVDPILNALQSGSLVGPYHKFIESLNETKAAINYQRKSLEGASHAVPANHQ